MLISSREGWRPLAATTNLEENTMTMRVSTATNLRWRRLLATLIAMPCALAIGTSAPAARAGTSGSGASWSSAVAISGTNQPDPTRGSQLNAVATNASGTTIAAWDQYSYTGSGGATIGA